MNIKRELVPLMAICSLALATLAARPPQLQLDNRPIRPQITSDAHKPGRIYLEKADSLIVRPYEPNVQILVGNVTFRREGMLMNCDSARFYTSPTLPADSMEAFGHIRMQQGDTLFLYGDEMEYSGSKQEVTIWGLGQDVKLINRNVTLTAPVLHYSMALELGYYDESGSLSDSRNTLHSYEAEYMPSTKEANFYQRVRLNATSQKGENVKVFTDTLLYNTITQIAELPAPAYILGKDGNILTSEGRFNTKANTATLLNRSLVRTNRGTTLTGDSIFYDNERGFGEAFGNMIITDSVRQSCLMGEYGFYNQVADSAYCTGRAIAAEYSRPDTLYLHGDVIRAFPSINTTSADTLHLIVANPNVRFWRRDMQGVCDSMTFCQQDSTIHMDFDPIVWSDNRQISANHITVYLNDSTIRRADLLQAALMVEDIGEDLYNQLSGREMIALFNGGQLRQLDINGSLQGILLPVENDSTINKLVQIESSSMTALFQGRDIERAHLWPATSGTVTPLFLAKKSQSRLPNFRWEASRRPTSPDSLLPPKEPETQE